MNRSSAHAHHHHEMPPHFITCDWREASASDQPKDAHVGLVPAATVSEHSTMPHESESTSVWMDTPPGELQPLGADTSVDVVIVGAGIAGLSVAHELLERGKSVAVLDDGPIGGGESSRTTAHLVTALDRRYSSIERMHGVEAAWRSAQSHAAAIDRLEFTARSYGIECGFARLSGFLFVPQGHRDRASAMVEQEHAAAGRAGVRCVLLDRAPTLAVDTGACLGFPDQAQFHPMRFLRGLARAIRARGGRIFSGSHVNEIKGGPSPSVKTSDGRSVWAGAVVVATHSPVNDVLRMHTKQVAYRSYVVALDIPKGVIPPALFWDGYWEDHREPYHYARLLLDPTSDKELLIVGGEDHKTGREDHPAERYRRQEQWARTMFPGAREVEYRWSGQILEPHDELAYIGRNPGHEDNIYVVTGDSGNGMTHAAIAGMMLPDLIDGKSHPWKNLYSPARMPTGAARVAIAETVEMLSEYRDWVKSHPNEQVAALAPGQGVVVRVAGRLVACYRGIDGRLVQRSAICPHLMGVVRWNAAERTWDCPCHGSRFNCEGRVIAGPANSDLSNVHPPVPTAEPDQPGTGSIVPDAGQILAPGHPISRAP